jgi:hypothetical protein
MFPEKYRDHQNIGPFKYRFRLSIFQINYSIDDIDYRLSHGLTTDIVCPVPPPVFILYFFCRILPIQTTLTPFLAVAKRENWSTSCLPLVKRCSRSCSGWRRRRTTTTRPSPRYWWPATNSRGSLTGDLSTQLN